MTPLKVSKLYTNLLSLSWGGGWAVEGGEGEKKKPSLNYSLDQVEESPALPLAAEHRGTV